MSLCVLVMGLFIGAWQPVTLYDQWKSSPPLSLLKNHFYHELSVGFFILVKIYSVWKLFKLVLFTIMEGFLGHSPYVLVNYCFLLWSTLGIPDVLL